jgi:hypothetical protein
VIWLKFFVFRLPITGNVENNSASVSACSVVVFSDCHFLLPSVFDFLLGTLFLADFGIFQLIQGIKAIGKLKVSQLIRFPVE